jgi:hypothetical protein
MSLYYVNSHQFGNLYVVASSLASAIAAWKTKVEKEVAAHCKNEGVKQGDADWPDEPDSVEHVSDDVVVRKG